MINMFVGGGIFGGPVWAAFTFAWTSPSDQPIRRNMLIASACLFLTGVIGTLVIVTQNS